MKIQTLVVSCESDNLIVSPVSVFSELLMMAMGSHGSTLEENEHALNLTIAGNPSWRKKMSKIQMELTVRDVIYLNLTRIIVGWVFRVQRPTVATLVGIISFLLELWDYYSGRITMENTV